MRKEDWRACCWRHPLQPVHWPDVVREERRKPLRQRQEDRLKRQVPGQLGGETGAAMRDQCG